MLRPLTGMLLALLVAAAGCQQESPSQPDKPAPRTMNGNGGNGDSEDGGNANLHRRNRIVLR